MTAIHRITVARLALLLGFSCLSLGAAGQGAGSSNSDAMLLLLEQNRNLQSEVQALRALVEEQGYEIRKLQRESLDRYTDTDNRLRNLEQGLASGGTSGVASSRGVSPTVTEPAYPQVGNQTGGGFTEPAGSGYAQPASPVENTVTPARGLLGGSTAGSTTAQPPSRAVASRASSNTRSSLEPAVLTEQQLYQMAYDSAINSQFERAIAEFDQYLSIYPQGRFTTNAHYWKGQSYLYLSRYNEAIAEYELILREYPNDAKVPDAMYGQAVALEGIGDTQRARRLLQQIMRNYPNTGVANLADTRLRSLN